MACDSAFSLLLRGSIGRDQDTEKGKGEKEREGRCPTMSEVCSVPGLPSLMSTLFFFAAAAAEKGLWPGQARRMSGLC